MCTLKISNGSYISKTYYNTKPQKSLLNGVTVALATDVRTAHKLLLLMEEKKR
jgi:hypothetical protein